jgi:hypothetical protein
MNKRKTLAAAAGLALAAFTGTARAQAPFDNPQFGAPPEMVARLQRSTFAQWEAAEKQVAAEDPKLFDARRVCEQHMTDKNLGSYMASYDTEEFAKLCGDPHRPKIALRDCPLPPQPTDQQKEDEAWCRFDRAIAQAGEDAHVTTFRPDGVMVIYWTRLAAIVDRQIAQADAADLATIRAGQEPHH